MSPCRGPTHFILSFLLIGCGFWLVASQTADSTVCGLNACVTCSSDGSACIECVRGYKVVGTECAVCGQECNECNASGCTSCSKYFGPLKNGTSKADCGACPVNCLDCSAVGSESCGICKEGFALTKGNICDACAENCQFCNAAGPGKCNKCQVGFTVSGFATELSDLWCLKCAPNCLSCQDVGQYRCDTGKCISGYEQDPMDFQCKPATTPTSTTQINGGNTTSDSSGLTTTQLIGVILGAVGGVILLALLASLCCFLCPREPRSDPYANSPYATAQQGQVQGQDFNTPYNRNHQAIVRYNPNYAYGPKF